MKHLNFSAKTATNSVGPFFMRNSISLIVFLILFHFDFFSDWSPCLTLAKIVMSSSLFRRLDVGVVCYCV